VFVFQFFDVAYIANIPKRGIQHEKVEIGFLEPVQNMKHCHKKNPQNKIQVKMWLKYIGIFLKNWEKNSQKQGICDKHHQFFHFNFQKKEKEKADKNLDPFQ